MNYTTCERIIARANVELQKAEIHTSTNFNGAINGHIVKLNIGGQPFSNGSAWIIIFAGADHLTILFGNFNTGQNFAGFAVKPGGLNKHFWISLCREILNARNQREKLLNNCSAISLGKNTWKLYQIGEQNV